MGRSTTHEFRPASVACIGILRSQFTRMRNGYFLGLHREDSRKLNTLDNYAVDKSTNHTQTSCRDNIQTQRITGGFIYGDVQ